MNPSSREKREFNDERGECAAGLLTFASSHRFGGDGAVGAAHVVFPEIYAEVPPLERAAGRHLQRARVARLHIHGRPAELSRSDSLHKTGDKRLFPPHNSR